MSKLQKRWEQEVKSLGDIGLPDSLDWADQNIPQARAYIESTYDEVIKAITFDREQSFQVALEKYTKAWLRLWQRMAIDHFKKNDITDVDMRYYRHLPDGYSMKWTSDVLGKTFTIYPRKPKATAKGELWITAGEMIKIHENPVVFSVMKGFDGWFDREVELRDRSMLEKVLDYEKKNPPPVKLKEYRRDKHGVRWFK